MAINEDQYNPGPLTALAGMQVGNLNLPLASIDVGAPMTGTAQGVQAVINLQQKMAELQRYYDIAKMQENNKMAVAQYQAGQTALQGDLNRQKDINVANINQAPRIAHNDLYSQDLANQVQNHQDMMNQNQSKMYLDYLNNTTKNQNDAEKTHLDQVKEDVAERTQKSNEDLHKRGAAAAMLLTAIQKDPDNAQNVLDMIHKEGLIDDNEYTTLNGKQPQEMAPYVAGDLMLSGYAAHAKDLGIDFGNKSNNLTAAALTQVQQQSMGNKQQVQDDTSLLKNFNPDYFGRSAQVGGFIGNQLAMIPGASQYVPGGDKMQQLAEDRANYFNQANLAAMNSLQTKKGMRFNQQTLNAYKQYFPSENDAGPDAWNKTVNLYRMNQAAGQTYDAVLKKTGNKDQAQAATEQYIQQNAGTNFSPLQYQYKDDKGNAQSVNMDYNTINKLATQNKTSFGNVVQDLFNQPYNQ